MNVLIELNQIDSRATREAQAQVNRNSFYVATDEPGENGVSETQTSEALPVVTRKVLVNPAHIRSITPRREGDGAGSRLTFADGGGYPVTETYEQIKSVVLPRAGVTIVNAPPAEVLAIADTSEA